MKHRHHIIPRHAGGTDELDNLVLLTVEEHALAHKKLWEEHGRIQDYIAWQSLSGQITHEEARRLAVSEALKGKPKTPEQKRKMSVARKKRGGITTGMKLPPCSEERKRKISEANKGKSYRGSGWKHKSSTKKKQSEAALNRILLTCSKCGKSMNKASLARHHGLQGEKCATKVRP